MKRFFAALCGLAFAFGLPFTAWAGDDLSKGEILEILMQTAPNYTSYISEEDIVSGYNEGDFRDEKLATDTEMLVMISRAFPSMERPRGLNYITLPEKAELGEDIPQWAITHFEYLNNRGIISSSLQLDDSVTKEELDMYLRRVWRYYGKNLKDDFYSAVNKDYFDKAMPGMDIYISSFSETAHSSNRQIRDMIYEIVKKGAVTKEEQKIKNIYLSSLEMQRGNGDMSPLLPYLKKIDSAVGIKSFSDAILYCDEEICTTGLFNFDITVDPKNSDRYIPVIAMSQPSFETEDYEKEKNKTDFVEYVNKIFALAGDKDASEAGELIYALEKDVSPHCLTEYEYYDVQKTYNLYKLSELQEWFGEVDLAAVAAADGLELGSDDLILVKDPGLVYNMARWLRTDLKTIKMLAKANILIEYGGTLSPECIKAGEKFGEAVSGVKDASLTVQERAVATTKDIMSDALSKMYCEKYFTQEDKAAVAEMTKAIKDVYRKKITDCEWMSKGTKEMALRKLNTMRVSIGYAEEAYDYTEDAAISYDNSLFKNAVSVIKAYNKYKGTAVKGSTDRENWPVAAFEANAFYLAVRNEMVLPAGILKEPFYSHDASIEENMAGIGIVIAHEMSHAFDSSGAGYDENGSYKNWWNEEDRRKFAEKCSEIAAFYDGKETAPDIATNGRFTLGEDIADLGAVICAGEALKQYENADMSRFYMYYAAAWAEISSREYLEYYSKNDEHPGSNIRVNLSLSNSKDFLETFGIGPGDGMYLPEEERVGIW